MPLSRPAMAFAAALVALAHAGAVQAQQTALGSFTLRGGLQFEPEFPGADSYRLGPDVGFSFGSLVVGRFGIGDDTPGLERDGLELRGAFRYLGPRDSDDFDALSGLDDVDRALEIGAGLSWRRDPIRLFGDLRYGVVGHEAFVGRIGADLYARPSDRLTLSAGPRVFFGQDRYARTYFGVSESEAARSGLDPFEAEGGALSAGLELGAHYRLTDDWGIEGAVTYDRLIGDAGRSPITDAGSADQYGVRIGITRRIAFGF